MSVVNRLIRRNPNYIPRKSVGAIKPSDLRSMLIKEGIDPSLATPLSKVFAKVMDKQATDERLNYDIIEKWMRDNTGFQCGNLKLYAEDTVSIANNTGTYVLFDMANPEIACSDAWDLSGTYPVCNLAGDYIIGGSVIWSNSSTAGRRTQSITRDSPTQSAETIASRTQSTVASTDGQYSIPPTLKSLAVGDELRLLVFQNSGGNLDLFGGLESSWTQDNFYDTDFWAVRVCACGTPLTPF